MSNSYSKINYVSPQDKKQDEINIFLAMIYSH